MDTIVKQGNDPDINGNGSVGNEDFAVLTSQWLNPCQQPDWCNGADLNLSKTVDIGDLWFMAIHWLNNTDQ